MLKLTRSGYINVLHPATGEVHSRHVQEREAVESAVNLAAELGREIRIQYDQAVAVIVAAPPPPGGDPGAPPTARLIGVAPRGRTMETHPPIKPGAPDIEIDLTEWHLVRDGMTVRLKPGTYRRTERLYRGEAWERGVTIDATGVELVGDPTGTVRVLELAGANERWHGLRVTGGDRGVVITGQANTLSRARVARTGSDGVYIFGEAARANHLRDVDVLEVGEASTSGTNSADGIAITANRGTVTRDHSLVRVRIDAAPDDALDLFRGVDCWGEAIVVRRAGQHHSRGDIGGDGSGMKLGGDTGSGRNRVDGGLAIHCKGEAIKANSAPLPVEIRRATVVGAGTYAFNPYTRAGSSVTECIATASGRPYTGGSDVEDARNSWHIVGDHPALEADLSVPPDSPLARYSSTGGPIGATDEALHLLGTLNEA